MRTTSQQELGDDSAAIIWAAAPGCDVTALPRVPASQSMAEHLDDLRGDR